MIAVEDVRDRIIGRVPQLAGRMAFASDFGRLMATGHAPQMTPAGYVLPGVMRGGAVTAITGLFRQDLTSGVKVVLFFRVAGDPLGDKGRQEAEPLFRAVIENVVGWCPPGAMGALALVSAELVGSADGCLVFEIDFAVMDQLRIDPT